MEPESPWVGPRYCWDLYSPGDSSVQPSLRTSAHWALPPSMPLTAPATTTRSWQVQNLRPQPGSTEREPVAYPNFQVIPTQVNVWEALPNNSQVTGRKSLLRLRTGS